MQQNDGHAEAELKKYQFPTFSTLQATSSATELALLILTMTAPTLTDNPNSQ